MLLNICMLLITFPLCLANHTFCFDNPKVSDTGLSVNPLFIQHHDHQRIVLKCHNCHEERINIQKRWFRKVAFNTEVKEIKPETNTTQLYVTAKNELVIQTVQQEDGGFYYCQDDFPKSKPEEIVYYIDVVKSSNFITGHKSVFDTYNKKIMDLNEEFLKNNTGFIVFVHFSHWSQCIPFKNKTGNGMRHKIGSCLVKINNIHKRTDDLNFAEKFFSPYKGLLSCHSYDLKKYFQEISVVVSELLNFNFTEDCCKIQCNDPSKIYYQEIELTEHDSTILTCRGSMLNSNVTWYKSGIIIKTRSGLFGHVFHDKHHVTLDEFNSLHLTDVQPKDDGFYECAIDGVKLERIRVNVIRRVQSFKVFLFHAAFLGLFLILVFYGYLSILVLKCTQLKASRK